jgi:hypothetical protein
MRAHKLILAAALTAFALAATSALAGSTKIQGNIVPPPRILDGGVDLDPPGAPDGVNDSIAVPFANDCTNPGIGACAADPNITCSLAPGSGSDVTGTAHEVEVPPGGICPGSTLCSGCPLCVEGLTGPDGITAGDVPTNHLASNGSKTQVQLIKAGNALTGFKAKVKCQLKDVLNGTNAKVTTSTSGNCAGGPNDGVACTKNSDCDDPPNKNFLCIGGDEFNCQLDGLAESNSDNSPPCGPCLTALVLGGAGDGCGQNAVGAICAVGSCDAGSVRPGQPCDITQQTVCPGGFCDFGAALVLTGDETGFYAPSFGGMGYLLCPTNFMLGFPVDVKNGGGQAQQDLAQLPISVCVPDGNTIEFKGLFVHDNNGEQSDLALLGFHTSNTTSVNLKNPCPDSTLPLPGSSTGLPTNTGTGPVIGVLGLGADL